MTEAPAPQRVTLVLGASAGGLGTHVKMLAAGFADRGITVWVIGPAAAGRRFSFAARPGTSFAVAEIRERPRAGDLPMILRLRGLLLRPPPPGLEAVVPAGPETDVPARSEPAVPTGPQVAVPAGSAVGPDGGAPGARGYPGGHVVHAHGLRAGALTVLSLIGVGDRRRPVTVVTVHNAPPAAGAARLVYRLLERVVARGADLVLCVSPDLERRLREAGARHVERAVIAAPAASPGPAASPPPLHGTPPPAGQPAAGYPSVIDAPGPAARVSGDPMSGVAGGAALRRPPHTPPGTPPGTPPDISEMSGDDPMSARLMSAGPMATAASPVPSGPMATAATPVPVGPPSSDTPQALASAGRPVVLAVGRLAPQKGLAALLEAAATWQDLDPVPLLAIAGDGPLAGELRAQAAALDVDARFLGHRDDVPALLAAAAVFALPSRWEGQPLVLQEALRAGTPVVATRTGGVSSLTGEDAALLVPRGDVPALAAAVRAVLTDPALAARLRASAADRAPVLPTEAGAVSAALRAYARAGLTGITGSSPSLCGRFPRLAHDITGRPAQ